MVWDTTRSTGDIYEAADHNETILQVKQSHRYHGFVNRTDSVLAWTDSTPDRTLTITGTYTYYYQGTAVAVSTSKAAQITNTVGLWWIYFSNAAGTLTASQGFPALTTTVVVATIWWNGTVGNIYDERHGYDRNLSWHAWAHQTIGCRYQAPGLAFTFTPATPTVAFALGSGTLWDEDINFSVPASSAYVPTAHAGRIFYQIGATTFNRVSAVSTRPYLWNAGTSRVQFVDSANSYTLTDIDSAKYVNVWLYGTMDKNILSSGNGTCAMFVVETIAGGTGYNTTALARAAPVPDISIMGLNPEVKLLYRIVVKGDGTVQTAVTSDDYRNIAYGVAGGTASSTASSVYFAPAGTISATNVQAAIEETALEAMQKAANVTLINDTGIADGEICLFNATNKDIRTSDKTIVTTIGADDLTIPTSKAVKDTLLDAFAVAGTSNTDRDANTTNHGLLLKAVAPASGLINFIGIAYGETVYALKALFDATAPAKLGTEAVGSAATAARRDHVHSAELTLADGKSVELKKALGTDATWSGITATMTAGENLTIGQVCYIKSDGKMWKALATNAGVTMPVRAMATASISADQTGVFLLRGFIRNDAWTLTAGSPIYPDASTAGAFTHTAPTGTGKQVQIIGYALSANPDIMYFAPDMTFIELT